MKIIGMSSRGLCFKGGIPGIRVYDQYALMIKLLFPLVSPTGFFPSFNIKLLREYKLAEHL